MHSHRLRLPSSKAPPSFWLHMKNYVTERLGGAWNEAKITARYKLCTWIAFLGLSTSSLLTVSIPCVENVRDNLQLQASVTGGSLKYELLREKRASLVPRLSGTRNVHAWRAWYIFSRDQNRTRVFRTERQCFARYSTNFSFNTQSV